MNKKQIEDHGWVKNYVNSIKAVSDEVEKTLDTLIQAVQTDIINKPVDKTELASESNNNIRLLHIYITKKAEQKLRLIKFEEKLKLISNSLYDYYKFEWDKSTKMTEGGIKNYVESHACHQQMNILVGNQQTLIDYLSDVLKLLDNRHYIIKNIIDLRKMELNIN